MASSEGDCGELARLLAASGVERPADEVRTLLEGVAAAPAGFAPNTWLDLVAPPQAGALRDHLRRLTA